MSDMKELNQEELEKVNGGMSESDLNFVNQILQAAGQKLIAKYGNEVKQNPEYKKLLAQEVYEIYLTLSFEEQTIIDIYNLEVEQLWSNLGGVIYFAE